MSIISVSTDADKLAAKYGKRQRELRVVMQKTLADIGQKATHEFKRPTRTWDHKPDFYAEIDTRSGRFEMLVGTDDEIFGYVDKGTKEHWIFPVRAKALRFLSGFRPKTTPNSLHAGHGGSFGETRFSMGVFHRGSKARNFTRAVQRKMNKLAPREIKKSLARLMGD